MKRNATCPMQTQAVIKNCRKCKDDIVIDSLNPRFCVLIVRSIWAKLKEKAVAVTYSIFKLPVAFFGSQKFSMDPASIDRLPAKDKSGSPQFGRRLT